MDDMMAAMGQQGSAAKSLSVYSGNTFHVKSATTYEVNPGDTRDRVDIAETTQPLIVKDTDVENLDIALEETALPKVPPGAQPEYSFTIPQ